MKRYLRADTGESHGIKVDKIQQSVKLAEQGTTSQRLALRMESLPKVTSDLNKGKGHIFDYEEREEHSDALSVKSNPNKLMAASMTAQRNMDCKSAPCLMLLEGNADSSDKAGSLPSVYSTVFKAVNTAPCSSGVPRKRPASRRRPPKSVRQQKSRE